MDIMPIINEGKNKQTRYRIPPDIYPHILKIKEEKQYSSISETVSNCLREFFIRQEIESNKLIGTEYPSKLTISETFKKRLEKKGDEIIYISNNASTTSATLMVDSSGNSRLE